MSKKLEIISEITAESLVLNVENATVRIVHSWDAKAITVNFLDGNDKPIGTLEEDIWSSLFKVVSKYRILDPNGKQIGESDKISLLSTDIELKDNNGNSVMTLHRPFWNWPTDNWSVQVHNKEIDQRLAPLIAAFKSAQDAEDHSSSSKSK